MFVKLPVQLTPSPEYPDLQEQEKLPSLFRQIDAPGLQLLSPLVHSFISNMIFVLISTLLDFFKKRLNQNKNIRSQNNQIYKYNYNFLVYFDNRHWMSISFLDYIH